MARLTDQDREQFRELTERGWKQSPQEKSPVFVEPTPAAIQRYCRWVSSIACFQKTKKPVRFTGDQWKL